MKRMDADHVSECPFLNQDDHRCRAQFSLKAIDQTFDLCLDRYRACSVYYALSREQPEVIDLPLVVEVGGQASPQVDVTVEGREVSPSHVV